MHTREDLGSELALVILLGWILGDVEQLCRRALGIVGGVTAVVQQLPVADPNSAGPRGDVVDDDIVRGLGAIGDGRPGITAIEGKRLLQACPGQAKEGRVEIDDVERRAHGFTPR